MLQRIPSPSKSEAYGRKIFCLLFLLVLALQFASAQNTQQSTTLEFSKPLEREIARGEKHLYQLTLAQNQYARILVEQRGIDVVLTLLGLDKEAFAQRDFELKTEGQEKIDFVALTAGVYSLEIRSKQNSSSAGGRYTVLLAELRDSTERERLLEEARKLHNQSVELYEAGDYDKALELSNRALEIREKESGADDIDVAASLAHLALIWSEKGDLTKAIDLNRRALSIREKNYGVYHQDVARAMHNLALIYSNAGNFDEAIRLYEKTIEIREKVLGANSPELATSLNNLGSIYLNLADYDKAESLMQRALEIKEKTLSPDSPSTATSLSNLAGIYSSKGDEDKALELYRRALEMREKALGPNHPELVRNLEFVGSSYLAKGDYKPAEENFLRGLKILQDKFKGPHYRIARMLGYLAVLYSQQGDFAKAEPLFEQTVEMMAQTVGKEHQDYATALYNEAWFYTDRGNYERAEPLYKQALETAEKNLGAQHPDVIIYLNGLARNYQAKGATGEALNLLTRAHQVSERNAQAILFSSSEKQKLIYLNSLSGETNQYISEHLRFAPQNAKALELALTTIFERKGRVSDALAFEFAALRSRFDKNDQILLDNLKKTTSELAQQILNGPEDETSEAHQNRIQELEEEKEKLEQEISRKSSEFRARIQPVTISSIQSAIPENAALIEFGIYRPYDPKAVGSDDKKAYGEPRYVAYVVHRQGAIQWKDLGETKAIDDALETFRQALRDPKRTDVRQPARVVDEKIMQPVRQILGGSTELLISPDGDLNLIPFEALVDEKGNYLVENYSFSYLTSGRDLLRMQVARESKNKALIIANPFFGEPSAAQVAKTSLAARSKTRDGKRRSVTATRNMSEVYFAPLGGTAQEARSIQTVFPEAVFLTGEQASESALKQTIAPRLLHIATHGFFLEDARANNSTNSKIENPLLRSGLALADANRRGGASGDDGILTALEAAGLNLWGTKLVVLSACDTGLGEVRNGEGVYGLRRAFLLAGTESLVMSLWAVSDFVTRELMTNYYKNLKQGIGRNAALRQVQLEMLKRPERRHPFYWASFIQSGEWANLDGNR